MSRHRSIRSDRLRFSSITGQSPQFFATHLARVTSTLAMALLIISCMVVGQWTDSYVADGDIVGGISVLDDETVLIGFSRADDHHYLMFASGGDLVWVIDQIDDVFSANHGVDIVDVAFASDQEGHRFLMELVDDEDDELRFWEWDGVAWGMTELDNPNSGQEICLALDSVGEPSVCYERSGYPSGFVLCEREEGIWTTQQVPALEGTTGEAAMCIDSEESQHILVTNGTAGDLYDITYACWDGSAWDTYRFEAGTNVAPSLVVDDYGGVHAAWGTGDEGEDLFYFYRDPGTGVWTSEQVSWRLQVSGVRVIDSAIHLDSHGRPHIVFSRGSGGVFYAYRDYSGWHIEEVGSSYRYPSLSMEIDHEDRIHIAYAGVTYAVRSLPDMQDGPEHAIEYVIAHWVNDALDPNDPCEISLDQILQAIAWWADATEVPETGGQTIDLDKMLDLIAKWAAATCIDAPFTPMSVMRPHSAVESMAESPAVSVYRTIAPSLVNPGDTVRVELTVQAVEDISGLGLDEDLVGFPGDWSPWVVTVVDSDGASYNAAEKQWVWLTLKAGDTRTIVYDVVIPGDAATGLHELSGAAQSASPTLNEEILGEKAIIIGQIGDPIGDGVIDICDIRLCYQIALGLVEGHMYEKTICDVDGDGDVDQDDVEAIIAQAQI